MSDDKGNAWHMLVLYTILKRMAGTAGKNSAPKRLRSIGLVGPDISIDVLQRFFGWSCKGQPSETTLSLWIEKLKAHLTTRAADLPILPDHEKCTLDLLNGVESYGQFKIMVDELLLKVNVVEEAPPFLYMVSFDQLHKGKYRTSTMTGFQRPLKRSTKRLFPYRRMTPKIPVTTTAFDGARDKAIYGCSTRNWRAAQGYSPTRSYSRTIWCI